MREQRVCPRLRRAAVAGLQQLLVSPAAPAKNARIRQRLPDARRRTTGAAGRPAPAEGGCMQLTRWNPFTELDEIQQRLNRLFLDRGAGAGEASFADFMPAVDIEETETEFIVKADLPDVKKEEIKIHVQDGVLAIEGERRQEKEEKGRKFHKIEREYGRFVRRFALPIEVDGDKVRAEFKDGVLNVVLPKAPAAKPKTIDIKIA
jgi:HSP20 family protein